MANPKKPARKPKAAKPVMGFGLKKARRLEPCVFPNRKTAQSYLEPGESIVRVRIVEVRR